MKSIIGSDVDVSRLRQRPHVKWMDNIRRVLDTRMVLLERKKKVVVYDGQNGV